MDLKKDLDNYFNHVLRNHLKYPEKFDIIFGSDNVTLLPNTPSQLLELLRSNQNLEKEILHKLNQGLIEYSAEYISSNGDDIIITLTNKTEGQYLDTGVYANIASNYDEEGLDAFCRSSTTHRKVCTQPEFWIELLKQRFPEYYVERRDKIKYNWERVYKGLLWYEQEKEFADEMFLIHGDIIDAVRLGLALTKDANRIRDVWINLFINHPESFKYMIVNNFAELSHSDIISIMYRLAERSEFNYDIIKHILNNYVLEKKTLINGFLTYLNNIPIAKLFLEYRRTDSDGNVIKITKDVLTKLLLHEANDRNTKLKLEDFDFYTQMIDQME